MHGTVTGLLRNQTLVLLRKVFLFHSLFIVSHCKFQEKLFFYASKGIWALKLKKTEMNYDDTLVLSFVGQTRYSFIFIGIICVLYDTVLVCSVYLLKKL